MNDNQPPPAKGSAFLRWIPWIILALTPLLAVALVLRACRQTTVDSIREIGKQIGDNVEKFKRGTITTTFVAEIPTIFHTPGGDLEIAMHTATETLRQSDNRTYDFRFFEFDAGTTVAEIKVPVVYRYHIRLHDTWRVDVFSNICIVYAPPIRPTLPPAIDTDRMIKEVKEPLTRFNGRELLDSLEKSITPTLQRYAADEKHLAVVREECRKTVAEFIRDWLLRENQWRDDRFHSIKIVFEDEKNSNLIAPTLELKKN
jgi:hypothetical protein